MKRGERGHVLIAEDNLVIQKVLTRMLASIGLSSTVVENGQQAVEFLQNNDGRSFGRSACTCVIMDVDMPQMDGLCATREIRKWEGTANGVANGDSLTPLRNRILCHSASATKDDWTRAGMDDQLEKPVKLTELRQAVETALEMQRASSDDSPW
eukprot:CAMPEP_0114540504 /NCGR_PEP_ID=MMETSP0114-20121206/804_1 /TAXON_ID=31324 /ORGANISM="Goniomonas sp, Strain m" /LENGTH=153 /DNA_ID=CAMNT_0001724673 /DNA_START=13 /DNA_END=471 /DNA_ORIENTATION=+